VAESMLLRVMKSKEKAGEENNKVPLSMLHVYLNDAVDELAKAGKEDIKSFAEGDEQKFDVTWFKTLY
jgi:hypothetical protein